MNVLAILSVTIFSIFSVVVMSYVAMATPLGPWIEPTVVLCTILLFKVLPARWINHQAQSGTRLAILIVAGSSVGGIMATAMGFAFPALFFLDQGLFSSWMSDPLYFWLVSSSLTFVGSSFGLWAAHVLEDQMLVQQRLLFPIGVLAYRMILAQNQWRKAKELLVGFGGTLIFCFGQSLKFIPRYLSLIPAQNFGLLQIPWVRFDFFPMYWAIGFVSGHMVAIPLLVGTFAKIFLVDPMNVIFFSGVSAFDFMLAFGSGLIVMGTLVGVLDTPRNFFDTAHCIWTKCFVSADTCEVGVGARQFANYFSIMMAIPILIFFLYFNMPAWVLIYLLVFTLICVYQVTYIAGKIGLAQLGRFATFVMLPAIFLFPLNLVNIVFIAVFVELACGVAADVLFGLKLAQLGGVSLATVKKYQFLGILVSSVAVGIVFWALIHKFGLGSEELFAQRAQTRALLVNVTHFNPLVVGLGVLFAYVLKQFSINPILVLSGLLMPINVSLSLVTGGLYALWSSHKEEQYPFWSGVFASHSLWMVLRAFGV